MTRIALAQINPTVGDLQGNRDKIIDFISRSKRKSADMAVFPELAVCGYPPEDLLFKKHFIRDNIKALRSIVKYTAGITVVVGFVDDDRKGHIYNAGAVMGGGMIKGIYRKAELPNYGVFDEKRYFTPGNKKDNFIFRSAGSGFAVNICEDIWVGDGPYIDQVGAGAGALLNISASPFHAGKSSERLKMLSRKAREEQVFICYTNIVGGQDELVFDGGSFIVDPNGKPVVFGRQFEEDLVVADIDVKASKNKARKVFKIIDVGARHAVPLQGAPESDHRSPITDCHIKKLSRIEEVYKALVLGTRDYIVKNGFKKVVLGLSGGIDSALVALIAAEALGPENVVGVSMPSKFTSVNTKNDAGKLAGNLGIRFEVVPIKGLFKEYLKVFKDIFGKGRSGIAEENVQARIRGNILMAFSNKYGWLVLSTGNKSESSVGYCTLYGDMAGGFSVIKDVPKMLVYELVKFVNSSKGKEIIPVSIIDRPPTAELKSGQKDTDSLPPYPVLDPVLKAYIEDDKSFNYIARKNKSDNVRKIIRMVDGSEYKRRQSSPGIRITPKAFGKDRRLPITNKYCEPGR